MNLSLAISCAKTIEALYANDIGPNISDRASDTQVLVEKMSTGHFAIVFPGTASARDWLTDLQVRKVQWGSTLNSPLSTKPKVHRGFANAYAAVREGILHIIPPGANLVITGHSLGGALATLCAEDLNDLHPIDSVITFGSPRVGNGPFARRYNDQLAEITARIVNSNDPIPHIPWIFGTYRHVATQHYLNEFVELIVDEPWRVAASELVATLATLRPNPATADSAFALAPAHGITAYREKLEALQ